MKYHLWIIGCQYNEWDGARLRYFLDSLGLEESSADEADIIVATVCAVRQTAVDRILGRAKNWKNKTIVATGCVLDNDRKMFAEKGIQIFKSGDYQALIKYLGIDSGNWKLETGNSKYVPIMTGCNNFCAYCAVPYTRGREKSRPMEEIISDVKNLVAAGHKEIMLLGQNVNSYQKSNIKNQNDTSKIKNKKTPFMELLERLNDIEGDFEIGFTSNHPKDMTDDIILAVAQLPKVKKEIHLPLQSGSDKVLRSMNRPYTIDQYLKIVDKIKKAKIDITTDVIVGYPTETEEDFEKTVDLFKKVQFKQAYINKYSPRAGTAAYKFGDPIAWKEKQRRWRVLSDIVFVRR